MTDALSDVACRSWIKPKVRLERRFVKSLPSEAGGDDAHHAPFESPCDFPDPVEILDIRRRKTLSDAHDEGIQFIRVSLFWIQI